MRRTVSVVLRLAAALALLGSAAADEQRESWLGVWLEDARDGVVEVVATNPEGPAQLAGVLAGDWILAIDGDDVGSVAQLGELLAARDAGTRVELRVLRGGRSIALPVRLGSRDSELESDTPAPAAPALALAPFARLREPRGEAAGGFSAAAITTALREHYGAPPEAGVLVTRVTEGSLVGRAGLRVGDVVVTVDGDAVVDPEAVRVRLMAWNTKRPIELRLVRDREPHTVLLATERAGSATKSAPVPSPQAAAARRRRIEVEIERLERRLEELRRELGRGSPAPPPS